eukprot:Gb_40672 [translate_table: standard]
MLRGLVNGKKMPSCSPQRMLKRDRLNKNAVDRLNTRTSLSRKRTTERSAQKESHLETDHEDCLKERQSA